MVLMYFVGKQWQQIEDVYGLRQISCLMTQCAEKTSELAAKVVEICNKKILSAMNTIQMETYVCESTR